MTALQWRAMTRQALETGLRIPLVWIATLAAVRPSRARVLPSTLLLYSGHCGLVAHTDTAAAAGEAAGRRHSFPERVRRVRIRQHRRSRSSPAVPKTTVHSNT